MNLYNSINKIDSMNALINARESYFTWLYPAREFVDSENLRSRASNLWLDKVVDFSVGGGAGEWYGDDRSLALRAALYEESRNKISILDTLVPVFGTQILEKHENGTFYYDGRAVVIGANSAHYHLLDILMAFGDADGFTSYDILIEKMEQRRDEGLFGKNKNMESVTMDTIENAYAALFTYSRIAGERFENTTRAEGKLIEVRRGEGLVLHNEIVI